MCIKLVRAKYTHTPAKSTADCSLDGHPTGIFQIYVDKGPVPFTLELLALSQEFFILFCFQQTAQEQKKHKVKCVGFLIWNEFSFITL